MPQAPIAAWLTSAGFSAGAAAFGAAVIQTILINVALGALEFRDENGELWTAVDGQADG